MKYKAKTKECQLIVKVKANNGETIDIKELDRFVRMYLRGFLKPTEINGKHAVYKGPAGISLAERMQKPITKRDFLFLMEHIVCALQKLKANGLPVYNLVMDMRHTFVNETTKEVQFIYVPLLNRTESYVVNQFLETLVYSVKPVPENDMDYVARFSCFLKNLIPYDANKIEQYIAQEDSSVVNAIKKQNAGQSGFITNKKQQYYEHYDRKKADPDATGLLREGDAIGLLNEEKTGLLREVSEETTLLSEDLEETTLLTDIPQDVQYVRYPSLCRVANNEKISIDKPVFRLGKERSYVDYFVNNNSAVSRSHADIITRENRYFVKDLNSKNRTFINEQPIPAQIEVEIFNGNRLRLGNEEFVFNL